MLENYLNGLKITQESKDFIDLYLKKIEKYKPNCIILFGSTSRNEHTEDSDMDLVIICENIPKNYFERNSLFIESNIDAFAYTYNEFVRMLYGLNPFAIEVIADGKPLYGKETYKRLKDEFEIVKRKYSLEKIEDGWRFDPSLIDIK